MLLKFQSKFHQARSRYRAAQTEVKARYNLYRKVISDVRESFDLAIADYVTGRADRLEREAKARHAYAARAVGSDGWGEGLVFSEEIELYRVDTGRRAKLHFDSKEEKEERLAEMEIEQPAYIGAPISKENHATK